MITLSPWLAIGLQGVFWLSAALVVWVYVGYPVLVRWLASRGARFGPQRRSEDTVSAPERVSVLIAAYNEEAVIDAKIRSVLASDYPAELLDIWVASDGSSDATVARVRAWEDPRVNLLDLPRGGKTTALNEAAKAAQGAVLIMTDATTEIAPSTVRTLVEAFADPTVGCVGADLEYVSDLGTAVGQGTGAYWRYERGIRRAEAAVCSMIGCSGALYAVRASAHRPIHPELDDDFTMPWEVYAQGLRTAYAIGAVSREPTNEEQGADFRMRVRVALRAIHALTRRRRYLNPFRYGWFAVQLLSHKWLRYAVPWLLILLLIGNAVLLAAGSATWCYGTTMLVQLLIYLSALVGGLSQRFGVRVPFVHLPYYFVHLNFAAWIAWIKFVAGDRAVTWDTLRN